MVVTHFPATTDALTSSGWLFGSGEHEHLCLRYGSSLLTSPTCPAIPPPIMFDTSAGFFFGSVVCSSRTDWLRPRHRCRPLSRGSGLCSGLRVYMARSPVIAHRIEFKLRLSRASFFADWQFAFSCSPRSAYAAAVTFHYRTCDLDPDGDFHPATLCAITVAPGRPYGAGCGGPT